MLRLRGLLRTLAMVLLLSASARAADRCPELSLEAGMFTATPAALEVSGTLGGVLALTQGLGPFLYGGSLSVSEAEEFAPSWRVTHLETRVRGLVGVRAAVGRGTWSLRLGLGATLVHEGRVRHDVPNIGQTNVPSEESSWRLVPALDLQGGLALQLSGAWGLALVAGPALHIAAEARFGFAGHVAIVWSP